VGILKRSVKRNKLRICIGFYAIQDYTNPAKDKRVERLTLEFTDESTTTLMKSATIEDTVDQLCPPPKKYRQVWSQQRGSMPFYAWKPIPPTKDFVAMGVVCTTTPDEPEQNAIRCMPRRWLIESTAKPTQVWDDSGSAGGRAGSFWVVNKTHLLQVSEGHEAPEGPYYEIWKERFHADECVPGFEIANPAQESTPGSPAPPAGPPPGAV